MINEFVVKTVGAGLVLAPIFYLTSFPFMTDYRGLLKHSLCVAEGEHPGFNKTTETQSSQRKALSFYGGKEIKVRLESGKCLFMIVRYCEFED